jgi:DNA-binding winged helix-turn-helix (wHTH) protein
MNKTELSTLEYNFPLDYRKDVIDRMSKHILACESFSLVGTEDNAKSNLMRFISLREDVRKKYFHKAHNEYLFIFVDLNELMEVSVAGFYQLIGLSLLETLKREKYNYKYLKNIFVDNPGLLYRNLRADLQKVIEVTGKRVVIVFNDFEVINTIDIGLLARNLVSMRNSARYKISYVFISTRPISLNQFFFKKIVWMTPFSGYDALGVVQRNAKRYEVAVSKEESVKIIELSGGHAGMIKFIIQALSRKKDLILGEKELCKESDLLFQCERLLFPLTELEKAKLRSCIKDDLLIDLGLQKETTKGVEVFSPILKEVLKNRSNLVVPFCYDKELDEVYLFGRPITGELNKKESMLLNILIEDPGKIFNKDELMEKIWGEEEYPNDWTFDKFISRLRKKLHISKSELLQTVRGTGIILNSK